MRRLTFVLRSPGCHRLHLRPSKGTPYPLGTLDSTRFPIRWRIDLKLLRWALCTGNLDLTPLPPPLRLHLSRLFLSS